MRRRRRPRRRSVHAKYCRANFIHHRRAMRPARQQAWRRTRRQDAGAPLDPPVGALEVFCAMALQDWLRRWTPPAVPTVRGPNGPAGPHGLSRPRGVSDGRPGNRCDVRVIPNRHVRQPRDSPGFHRAPRRARLAPCRRPRHRQVQAAAAAGDSDNALQQRRDRRTALRCCDRPLFKSLGGRRLARRLADAPPPHECESQRVTHLLAPTASLAGQHAREHRHGARATVNAPLKPPKRVAQGPTG